MKIYIDVLFSSDGVIETARLARIFASGTAAEIIQQLPMMASQMQSRVEAYLTLQENEGGQK